MSKNSSEEKSKLLTPFYLLLIVATSIFVAELLVMLILSQMPNLTLLHEALIDSFILIVFVFPILYLYVFRPISMHITERKKAEEKLKKYSDELEESNKLKDLFIDSMQHDLLNSAMIISVLNKQNLEKEEDQEKKESLQTIKSSIGRMIKMIKNASMLAKLEADRKLEMHALDLGQLIKDAINEMIPLADEKKIKITLHTKGEFKTLANPLVSDVFSNLIGNAIKFSHEKSEIVIRINEDSSNYTVSVSNKGDAIPDKYKETIFDRFTRIKKGGVKGTGLGLAIVKKIVDIHSGKVWVEDNPEGGSIFIVTLPKTN